MNNEELIVNNEELNVGADLVPVQASKHKTNATPVGASIARPFRKKQGITLIALIITIIVMLILAGVVLNLTIGERGIFKTARGATKNYTNASEQELAELDKLDNTLTRIIENINTETDNTETSTPNLETLVSKVSIGDYVAYNPTEGVSDVTKLTYTSPVGTGTSHGNGYAEEVNGQTFTANDNIKWRVLSKNEDIGEVVLISDEPIKREGEKGLNLYGAIGYLYGEQELNEICKIYGYGKGADTSKTFIYQIGDTLEELEEGIISGSGARCINVDDINKITGYNPEISNSINKNIYYPTKTTESGISASAVNKKYSMTYYSYIGLDYLTDQTSDIYRTLFRNKNNSSDINYWLASRRVNTSEEDDFVYFGLRNVSYGKVNSMYQFRGAQDNAEIENVVDCWGIRPIVYLKSNIKTVGQDKEGKWIINE